MSAQEFINQIQIWTEKIKMEITAKNQSYDFQPDQKQAILHQVNIRTQKN